MGHDNATTQFAEAIRTRRKSLGMNQLQLCDLAGVGPAFLYQLEQGKPTARMDKVLAVLKVLGLGLELVESHEPLTVRDDTDGDHP